MVYDDCAEGMKVFSLYENAYNEAMFKLDVENYTNSHNLISYKEWHNDKIWE